VARSRRRFPAAGLRVMCSYSTACSKIRESTASVLFTDPFDSSPSAALTRA
jgi:hypothetical protein